MQVQPDYSKCYSSPREIEDEIINFSYKGQGWYLYHDHTMLLLTFDRTGQHIPWYAKPSAGATYNLHVWYAPFERTVFAFATGIPTARTVLKGKAHD